MVEDVPQYKASHKAYSRRLLTLCLYMFRLCVSWVCECTGVCLYLIARPWNIVTTPHQIVRHSISHVFFHEQIPFFEIPWHWTHTKIEPIIWGNVAGDDFHEASRTPEKGVCFPIGPSTACLCKQSNASVCWWEHTHTHTRMYTHTHIK